jgi:hypothetical protein
MNSQQIGRRESHERFVERRAQPKHMRAKHFIENFGLQEDKTAQTQLESCQRLHLLTQIKKW